MSDVVLLFDDDGTRRNSAAALDALRRHVQAAGYVLGARLPPERILCVELGLARGALRRALDVLEAEGVVTRIQGSGTYLGRPARAASALERIESLTNPFEVIEARLALEPVLARLAAQRAGPVEIAAIRHRLDRHVAAGDGDEQELWDGALHRSIAAAAGNGLLLALFEAVDRVRQNEEWRALRRRARSADSLREDAVAHARIVAALAARDGAASESAMRVHLENVAARLRAVMSQAAASRTSDRGADVAHG